MKDQLKQLFAGICAHAHETYVNLSPFPADQRASRKWQLVNRKRFVFLSFQTQNLLLLCNECSGGQLSGHANTYNARIWSSENPHEVLESQRDSPELNAFLCYTSAEKIWAFRFRRTN
ncbi:hypothetical protein TNCV_4459231 [Trichonephila clavipes]|nr:hypothetical protein TNCV_4459231 [Trichonephila clavipes]